MNAPGTVAVPEPVLAIVRTLTTAGYEAWCVGGALRDALLGEPQSDFDIATSATPDQVQSLFRRTVAVGARYGTIGVLDGERVLHEVTTFRKDVSTDGRGAEVAYGVSLQDDLARRDFTINAIAYQPLTGEWSDPFDGARDLAARVLRAVGRPDERFQEDFLRVLRALRFTARLELQIDPATWAAMRASAPGLTRLSAERVREEWFKGLRSARRVGDLVALWHASGAAAVWLPELSADAPASLSAAPRDPVLLTVALMPDPGAVLRTLKASNAEIARATAAASASEPAAAADEREVRRWLSRTGAAADDVLRLRELRDGAPAPWSGSVDTLRRRGDPVAINQLAVSGSDLLAAGLRGPAVGAALQRLLDLVLDDPALNQRDRLLALLAGAA